MLSPDPSRPPRPRDSPEENIVLRRSGGARAHREDEAFVLALGEKTFLAYGSYDRYLADWFHHDDVITYIAERHGRPVGFYMLTCYRDSEGSSKQVADLVAIAVEPGEQSRGIGGQLLDHALELASRREPPAEEVWLVVAEGNARAQRFFARRGFRLRAGVGVYPAGQRALRMVKSFDKESRS